MKHVAWAFSDFQTHSDRCRFGSEIVRVGADTGWNWEGVREGGGLEVCEAGTDKNFNPRKTLAYNVIEW